MKQLLKMMLFSNLRNKITALILAVVIWLVVSFEVSGEYERSDISVEIVPLKNGTVMKNIAVEPSNLIVKAKFDAPQRVGPQYLGPAAKVRAVHRIENPPIGVPITIRLNREDFDLPYDIKLTQVEPRRLEVILRRIITKKLPVHAVTRGKPAQGHEIAGEPVVEPTEVTVRGPKEVLEVASFIPTEPIDIEGRSSSFSTDYALSGTLNDKKVETQTKVRVRVNIKPIEIVKMAKIPVNINVPVGYDHEVLLPKSETGGIIELPLKGPEFILNNPASLARLKAFVVVTPDMVPRPGIPYSVRPNLFTPPELSEIKLAGEPPVDVEIREKTEEKSEDNGG